MPAQRRSGVDPGAGEGEPRRALASDAAREAHGAAGARHEAHRELGEHEPRIAPRDHAVRERRHLDARADAGAVHAHLDAAGEARDPSRRTAGHADRVRGRGVRRRAELVEVAAAAERGAGPGELDARDLRVVQREPQRLAQRVAHRGGESVALLGAIEAQRERPALPRHQHSRLTRRLAQLALVRGDPGAELRPALEGRVDERLRDEAVVDRALQARAQELHEAEAGERRLRGGLLDRGEISRIGGAEAHVEDRRERVGRGRVGGAEREAHGGQLEEALRGERRRLGRCAALGAGEIHAHDGVAREDGEALARRGVCERAHDLAGRERRRHAGSLHRR